ncbi:MAG: heparinase II/III family protein, partial [Armatimonadota bacterium]
VPVSSVSAAPADGGAAVHPRVYLTPTDLQRARDNVRHFAWARTERDAIVTEADHWLARPDDWYVSVFPKAGACFAYGFTGCPICGGKTGTWFNAHCDWSRPGTVQCENGHMLPDAAHPDDGTGYIAPDKRIHYFVGSYNAWVIEKLIFSAANSLAYAYSLTGDDRYAAKCALILDRIAAIYPACDKGSWDYPSNPPSGRLDRPWYQVARVLVHLTDQYDQIFPTHALDIFSATPGLTRRKNIEENLLKNGAAYCFEQSKHYNVLNNGNADYIRGAMAVGICLDIPEYITFAVDSACGARTLLDNNLDRDGKYYETSTLYADHSRELYLSFAEPLANYRGSAYPQGVDLYAHPRLRRFLMLNTLSQECCGQTVRYGDSGPAPDRVEAPTKLFNARDLRSLERLHARTPSGPARREIGALIRLLCGHDVEAQRLQTATLGDIVGGGWSDRCWLLFHADAIPRNTAAEKKAKARLDQLHRSDLFGQKGVAILRRGSGKEAQGVMMRYGPVLNHGHFDDLNINFFSHGYEVTYDLGYGLGTTHTQVGWAKQTASHNLVVVDEASQNGIKTGGSLHLFAELGPNLQVMEASADHCYVAKGVTQYRRTVALIDGVLLDLFRVRGGKQHDYLFHSIGSQMKISGVTLGAEEKGSLAGPDFEWGNLQLNDGDMTGYPNKPNWSPPPGNGYGFLTHVRRGTSSSPFHAEWEMGDEYRVRLHIAPDTGTEAISAVAPGIYPSLPKAGFCGLRRRAEANLQSVFAAVAETFSNDQGPSVEKIERLVVTGPVVADSPEAVMPVAVRITRRGGIIDTVYSSGDTVPRVAGGITFAARFAHIRTLNGKRVSVSMAGGESVRDGNQTILTKRAAWTGLVREVDAENSRLTVAADLPTGSALTGRVIAFSHPAWSRNSAYRIHSVESAGKGLSRIQVEGPLSLGRGIVKTVPDKTTITTDVPHEYFRPLAKSDDSGFMTGKQLLGAQGAGTRLQKVKLGAPLTLTVDDSTAFRPGDVFRYQDVSPGDSFEIIEVFTTGDSRLV